MSNTGRMSTGGGQHAFDTYSDISIFDTSIYRKNRGELYLLDMSFRYISSIHVPIYRFDTYADISVRYISACIGSIRHNILFFDISVGVPQYGGGMPEQYDCLIEGSRLTLE